MTEMQASGSGSKGAPDPTGEAPGKQGGGESGGGAYPNPQTGKTEKNEGFFKHGGQTEIAYSGPGDKDDGGDGDTGNANAVTK